MKAHGHYFSSEIPWESSARSHGHNTTILILNFNEKHKCSAESSPESDWLGQQPSTNEASREFEIMAVIIKTKKLQYFTCTVLCWSVVLLSLCVSLFSVRQNQLKYIGKFKHSSLTPCVFLQCMIKYRITGFYANFRDFNSVAPCPT